MAYQKELMERLDKLTHEVSQIKASLVHQAQADKSEADKAWQDLMEAVEEISSSWSGCSALEEIRAQRE